MKYNLKIFISFTILSLIIALTFNLVKSNNVILSQENKIDDEYFYSLRINYEDLFCPLDINEVKVFDVAKINNKESEVDEALFYKLFQYTATERVYSHINLTIPPIKHTKEFLLTKHNIESEWDFITLLKETDDGNIIYWLSYHSKDTILEGFIDSISFAKGQITNHGILSEKYENDSIKYQSFSTFYGKNRFIVTEVKFNKIKNIKDSTRSLLELEVQPFHDGFKAFEAGQMRFQNDKLIETWQEEGYDWEYFKK